MSLLDKVQEELDKAAQQEVPPDPSALGTPSPSSVLPWSMGRGGQATNYTRGQAQSFARSLLESETYRRNLETRLNTGTLPPAVETMLWHYAYGKPMEQVELTVVQREDLRGLSIEELYKRAEALAEQLAEAKAMQDALPAEIVHGPW